MRQWVQQRDGRRAWSRNANRAQARRKAAAPAPDYPRELPAGSPMLRIRLDGYLVHAPREIWLTSTRRSNVFDAHLDGEFWRRGGIGAIFRASGRKIARPLSRRRII